jgi:hypothetical protein
VKIRLSPAKSFLSVFFLILVIIYLGSCSAEITLPNRYAIVYGIAIYDTAKSEGYYPNLSYTNDDAEDIAALLQKNGYEVLLRTDEDATKEQLLSDMGMISQIAEPESSFVFYYSGHGGQDSDIDLFSLSSKGSEVEGMDEDEEWIFLHGSLPIDPFNIENNLSLAINDDELFGLMSEIRSNMKTVIIDACNSGGFIGASPQFDMVPQDYRGTSLGFSLNRGVNNRSSLSSAFSLYFSYTSQDNIDVPSSKAIVLAAAGEQEFSYEYTGSAEPENGVFTYFFLESEMKGDRNGDGYITLLEAYAYTVNQIQKTWNEKYGIGSSLNFLPHISGGAVDYVLFESN